MSKPKISTDFTPVQLGEESCKLLMQFSIVKKETELRFESDNDNNLDSVIPNEMRFLILILLKRIKHLNLPFIVTDYFILMSIVSFADNPGKIMILLRMMYDHYRNNPHLIANQGKRIVRDDGKDVMIFNHDKWCMDMFPNGVPAEKDLNRIWDNQKVKEFDTRNLTDNMLDNSSNWEL